MDVEKIVAYAIISRSFKIHKDLSKLAFMHIFYAIKYTKTAELLGMHKTLLVFGNM